MSHKRSRKQPRSRSASTKKPDLRTAKKSKGESASQARARAARLATERKNRKYRAKKMAALRVRPDGTVGLIAGQMCGWLVVAALLGFEWYLNRWYSTEYPDSIWYWVSIGSLIGTVAVAYVARSADDIMLWVRSTAGMSLVLLALEFATGPKCPENIRCGTIGARGSMTLPGSVLFIALLGVASWYFGKWFFGFVSKGRPANGHQSVGVLAVTWVIIMLVGGAPLVAIATGLDLLARKDPALARKAISLVEENCFGLETPPSLILRADPDARADFWSSYLVRRVGENRKGFKNHQFKNYTGSAKPYEAVVSVSKFKDVDSPNPQCRKVIDPNEQADENDYKDMDSEALKASPLRPQDALTQEPPPPPAPTPAKKPAAKKSATKKK